MSREKLLSGAANILGGILFMFNAGERVAKAQDSTIIKHNITCIEMGPGRYAPMLTDIEITTPQHSGILILEGPDGLYSQVRWYEDIKYWDDNGVLSYRPAPVEPFLLNNGEEVNLSLRELISLNLFNRSAELGESLYQETIKANCNPAKAPSDLA